MYPHFFNAAKWKKIDFNGTSVLRTYMTQIKNKTNVKSHLFIIINYKQNKTTYFSKNDLLAVI